jgi:hypothetical protein
MSARLFIGTLLFGGLPSPDATLSGSPVSDTSLGTSLAKTAFGTIHNCTEPRGAIVMEDGHKGCFRTLDAGVIAPCQCATR